MLDKHVAEKASLPFWVKEKWQQCRPKKGGVQSREGVKRRFCLLRSISNYLNLQILLLIWARADLASLSSIRRCKWSGQIIHSMGREGREKEGGREREEGIMRLANAKETECPQQVLNV